MALTLKAHYENVYAVMDGMVTETGWDSKGGGNFIKVKHYGRFETAYLHLSEIYYRAGELVKAGYIIAKSGNSETLPERTCTFPSGKMEST
jgi:murein DD-endopeptidase MepM/ murein hydrolase activator NlpD